MRAPWAERTSHHCIGTGSNPMSGEASTQSRRDSPAVPRRVPIGSRTGRIPHARIHPRVASSARGSSGRSMARSRLKAPRRGGLRVRRCARALGPWPPASRGAGMRRRRCKHVRRDGCERRRHGATREHAACLEGDGGVVPICRLEQDNGPRAEKLPNRGLLEPRDGVAVVDEPSRTPRGQPYLGARPGGSDWVPEVDHMLELQELFPCGAPRGVSAENGAPQPDRGDATAVRDASLHPELSPNGLPLGILSQRDEAVAPWSSEGVPQLCGIHGLPCSAASRGRW